MILAGCRAPLKTSDEISGQSLTFMTYNVLYGFNHQKNIKEGVEWIKSQNPDVLALQELNDFNGQKLKETAAQWNHNHAVILKEQGFPVGLTSKMPIEVIEKRIEGFHHGYLHCRTSGIDFLVVHLAPNDYLMRRKEADMIVEKANKILADNKHLAVLGDFNSFSASDMKRMDTKTELLERQKKGKNLNNGQFDYSVMERFRNSGLVDICDKLMPDTDALRFSFPTKMAEYVKTEEEQKKFARRIDYIWMDPDLAGQCTQALIPRDNILDSISDHFPIIVTLKKNK
jgi:exonuclease III